MKASSRNCRDVFFTEQTVLITASSGTGFWEAAVRNTINKKALNCVNGAFSDRFRMVTELNGKENEVLEVPWGQPILAEQVAERLAGGGFDAVTVVHNETSTGVTSPLQEIADAVRGAPNGEEIMILVDTVSGLSGARLRTDAWDLDVVLASSQKAFALPPGLAFCAVSERAMAKAKTVPNRGYYFDFLALAKVDGQVPDAGNAGRVSCSTPWTRSWTDMLAEGMENRFQRHLAMRDSTIEWATSRDFSLYAAPGYESPTVTCINNDRQIDICALNAYLREQGMIISNGYGALKGKNFRIAHMGDCHPADMEVLFANIDDFLAQ